MPEKNIIIRPNPFPGLRAFRPDEGHLFFGRVESTLKVVNRLKDNRFVAVIGASGSGKSSLVLSGVIPALLKENTEDKKSWSYLVFRPDQNPVDHLAAELTAFSAGAGFSQLTRTNVAASLHNRSEGLPEVINKLRKNLRQQIVIVIDQFEEIFRFSPASERGTQWDEASEFVDLIVNGIKNPDQGLHIILTLRSEYVSDCARFHTLNNLMNSSSYLLPQIPTDLLGSVIEEPVKAVGASIDHTLVRFILSEMEERQGQLPVLQHLMMRLWNHWGRTGDMSRPISVADYEAVGKLQGAISQHAGLALESLDERHRYVCSRLFRTITTRTEDGREMRKPERVSTIAAQTGCSEKELITVAEVFRAPEYSFITPSKEVSINRESILDLTHDSIIGLWSTLRKWMDDEEASKKLYLKLAAAAEQYQEGTGRLWVAPDLLIALRWRDENNPTLAWAGKLDPAFERAMLFLKNSEEEYLVQEEYRRKTGTEHIKRSRLLVGLLILITLLALIALGVAYSLKNRAEKQKSVALQLKEEAVAYGDRLSDSLDLLNSSYRIASEQADNDRLNAAASAMAAEANERASSAESMAKEISIEKSAALNRANEADRYRMLSLARSLAMRSLNHGGDKDVQILLARQSWIFNQRHSGITEDADVFSALYEVSKRYGNRFFSRFTPEGAEITALTGALEGHSFYTADTRGRVLRWQSDNQADGYQIIWSGDKIFRVMTLSPDGSLLACGTDNSEIVMIPVGDDSVGYSLQDSSGAVTALVFSGDGEHFYTSTAGGGVNEWDLKTRKGKKMDAVVNGIAALEISQDNSVLAALTIDGRVLCWKRQSPGQLAHLETGDRVITSHKFIPGGDRLVTGDDTGIIEIWNTSTKAVEENIEGHRSAIKSIAFDSSDGQMVTADDTGEIKLWTLANLKQPPVVFADGNSDVIRLTFCENGEAFLTATALEVIRRPAHVRCMTNGLCDKVSRNLTEAEWSAWVGSDIEYEAICPEKGYQIRVREIQGAR